MTIIKPLYFCLHRVSPFPPWLSGLPVISKRSRSILIVKHNCHIHFTCFMQYQKLLQFPDISYSCSLHKRHLIASPSLNTQLFSNELSQSQGNLYQRHINKQFFWSIKRNKSGVANDGWIPVLPMDSLVGIPKTSILSPKRASKSDLIRRNLDS